MKEERREAHARGAEGGGNARGQTQQQATPPGRGSGAAAAIGDDEVARRVTGKNRDEALRLAEEGGKNLELAHIIRRERLESQFRLLADPRRPGTDQGEPRRAEDSSTTAARPTARATCSPPKPTTKRHEALARRLDEFPSMKEDISLGDDLVQMIRQYKEILRQLDEKFPTPFILQDTLDKHGSRQ